jgi:hypothetical protein
LRTASVRRTVAAALIAGTLGATGGTAQAASQVDDLTQGTHGSTALVAGGVEIAPAFDAMFNGSALPQGFESRQWTAGTGGATPNGSAMIVDRARGVNGIAGKPGSSLSFTATFGGQRAQHVGFAIDFNSPQWAAFSTWESSDTIYARVRNGGPEPAPIPIPGVVPGTEYKFQIDWTATGFVFSVDGIKRAQHDVAIPAPAAGEMPFTSQASDFDDSHTLAVKSMSLRNVVQGTFESRVFDAGDARVASIAFGHEQTTPANTSIAYETSTSSDGSNWSAWSAGAIPPARYFKYRAILNTTDVAVTPRLTKATVDFTIANTNPGGGTTPPAGDTKKPRLSMPRDADVNRRGKVKILLTCPDDELFCRAALVFKSGRKTVASKSGKIAGGDSRYLTLKLSTAAKKQLAKARKLKVAATLKVTDAAGNKRTSSKKIWLYPI